MCPDRDLLSAYADSEIPSPWKEKLERHLASCPDCAGRVQGFRTLSSLLVSPMDIDTEAAKARTWKSLSARIGPFSTPQAAHRQRLWEKSLVVPWPAAAAALILFVFIAAFVIMPGRQADPGTIASINSTSPQAVPVSDVTGMLKSIGSQDSGADIIIIRLPEAANFDVSGEPTLVRAADYIPVSTSR